MRIVIFGASGRTGRALVEQALAAGHTVTAFVRTPASFPLQHEQLRVVQGDVTNSVQVAGAIAGQDAVVCALGHRRDSHKDLQAVATRNIVAGMKAAGVRRLVSMTGAGVHAPQDQPKVIDRAIRMLLVLMSGDVLRDAETSAQIIEESGLDWVIARGPRIVDGPHTGVYRVGFVGKDSGIRISCADIADFMLKELTDDTYLHQLPLVSY